ncbi:DUF7224 domain-containing protein [Streptomyces antimycoticus]
MVRTESRKAVARLRQAGVAVPITLTMPDRPGSEETKLAIGSGVSTLGVPTGVAAGLLPQSPGVPRAPGAGPAGVRQGLPDRHVQRHPQGPARDRAPVQPGYRGAGGRRAVRPGRGRVRRHRRRPAPGPRRGDDAGDRGLYGDPRPRPQHGRSTPSRSRASISWSGFWSAVETRA